MRWLKVSRRHVERLSLVLVVAAALVGGYVLGHSDGIATAQDNAQFTTLPPEAESHFEALYQTYNFAMTDFVNTGEDPITPERLVNGAIDGMVNALGDQYSYYIDPETLPEVDRQLRQEYVGMGVVINTIEESGLIQVNLVVEDSPAMRAGVQEGDIFIEVDGDDVTDLNQGELVLKTRGLEGEPINVTMRRGREEVEFDMIREKIKSPSVSRRVIEDTNIGYIRLNRFDAAARQEFDAALEWLEIESRDGLILDLRSNPGGLLGATIEMVSAFIPEGVVMVEEFSNGDGRVFNTNGSFNPSLDGVPVVVLVNDRSMSASEVFSGALQDQERAVIVGEITFGKGTVQTMKELTNDGGIRLTIAKWGTPDRHFIHGQGITPDVIVDWSPSPTGTADNRVDQQLQAAITQIKLQVLNMETQAETASGPAQDG